MTTDTPAREFLLPGLNNLIAEGQARGISREVAVAVLIDLVTGPGFNDVPLDPREDTAPQRQTDDMSLEADEEGVAIREEMIADREMMPKVPAHEGGVFPFRQGGGVGWRGP